MNKSNVNNRNPVSSKTMGSDIKYKIAICDDEIYTCKELDKAVIDYFQSNSLSVETDVFYSGETLIDHMREGFTYDFILLDIELYELNGIGVGKFIRDIISDVKTQIIFISSKTMYAMELFRISPLDFLIKPISYNQLSATISRGLSILNNLNDYFECMVGNTVRRMPISRILYFESDGRKIHLFSIEDEIVFYDRLSNVYEKLSDAFIQIHKSFIVNSCAVKEYHVDHLILYNMKELPISRSFKDSVKSKIMGRLGE